MKNKKKIKLKYIKKINNILKNIFELKKNTPLPDINVYFIDTEYDEIKNTYEEVFQGTINIMMEKMKLDVDIYDSINAKNLDVFGNNVKIRNENYKKEIEKLEKLLKKEKLRKEKEEKERIRLEKELENEKNNQKNKEKEKRLEELIKAKEEQRKKYEEIIKRNNEIEERRKMIEEEAIKKGIKIEKLDRFINSCLITSKSAGLFSCSCCLLCLGGVLLSGAFPIAGPLIASSFFDATIGGLSGSLAFGIYAAGAKVVKEIIK